MDDNCSTGLVRDTDERGQQESVDARLDGHVMAKRVA